MTPTKAAPAAGTQPPACGKISDERLRELIADYAQFNLTSDGTQFGDDTLSALRELLSLRHPAPVADERAEVEHTWDDLITLGDKFKLPVDVKILAGTFTKGVKVGTMLRCVKHHAGYASEIPDSEYPTLGVWSPDIAALSAQPSVKDERTAFEKDADRWRIDLWTHDDSLSAQPPGALEREKCIPLHDRIQHVYTRNGRAAVCGIPDDSHDCDQMACSSVEHVLARVDHSVDEKPARDAMTDWRNGENMAAQNTRVSFEDLVDVVTGKPIDPMKRTYGGVTQEQFDAAKNPPPERAPGGDAKNICYCGEYGGGVHTLSARCERPAAPPQSSIPSATADATLRAALEKLRTNIDAGLLTALRNGGQLDMDGCEVRVSRQACEEAADHLEQLAALAGNEGEGK